MAVLSFSDIIIAVTLITNAVAVMSTRIQYIPNILPRASSQQNMVRKEEEKAHPSANLSFSSF
jgi:hypothetical protein